MIYAVRQNQIPGLLIPRASSLLLSDLALAFYMLIAVPIGGAMLVLFRRLVARFALDVLTVLTIGTAALTVTRTVIVAMAPLLLVVFLRPRGFLLGLLVAGQLVVGASLVAYQAQVSVDDLREVFSTQDSSVQGHLAAMEDSLDILRSEPFGRGLGTSGQVAQRFAPTTGITNESWYFQIGSEIGIPAMLLWILLTAALPVLALVRYGQVRDPWLKSLCLGIAASMVGYAFASYTLHAWEGLASSIIFWLFAGFAISAPTLEREWRRRPGERPILLPPGAARS